MQQDQLQILFYDHLDHVESIKKSGKVSQVQSDEIQFKQPVRIDLIRILKQKSTAHHNLKKIESVTQTEQIKNFEIFYKDITKKQAAFRLLLSCETICDKQQLLQDVLIPSPKGFFTDFLVFKGNYYRMTICIYGQVVPKIQARQICPYYNTETKLEDLIEFHLNKEKTDKIQRILENPPVYKLESFIIQNIFIQKKYTVQDEHINPILVNNVVNTYEESVKNIETLSSQLNAVNSGQIKLEKEKQSQYYLKLEQLAQEVSNLFIGQDIIADFVENKTIYHAIPLSLVEICTQSLQLNSPSDYIRGLDLALVIMNSYDHSTEFLEANGLLKIFNIFQQKSEQNNIFSFSSIKLKAIEIINMALNYKLGCKQFLHQQIVFNEIEKQSDDVEKKSSSKKKKKDKKKHKNKHKKSSKSPAKKSKKEKESKKKKNKNKKKDSSSSRSSSKNKSKSRSRSKSKSKSKLKKKTFFESDQTQTGYHLIIQQMGQISNNE